jgi:pyruvate/2-oxoglutarate dehydrogenase complex dihydrolipoamide acyltransferase (E2) component
MNHTLKMPKLGDATQEVIVESWEVAVGASVAVGDILMIVETDKVNAEVPSPVAGTLAEQLVAEGDEVQTGAPYAVVQA